MKIQNARMANPAEKAALGSAAAVFAQRKPSGINAKSMAPYRPVLEFSNSK
jgi:hypothetical protein